MESFVVFHKSCYVFCVPYAFAIGNFGKSAISPRLDKIYTTKDQKCKCTFDDINGIRFVISLIKIVFFSSNEIAIVICGC